MSKRILTAALAAGMAFAFAPGANAADGTITINGLVLGRTCTINGGASDFTVTLPTVMTSDFAAAGDVAGKTGFDITLSNCETAAAVTNLKVSAYFSSTNTDSSSGYLNDTVGAAGVQIELLDNTDTTVDLRKTSAAAQSSETATVDAAGAATLHYAAQYRAIGATVSAGRVATTVDYTINYM